MSYPAIVLKSGRDRPLRFGHPWVFSGAVKSVEGSPQPGDVVRLRDNKGRDFAVGYYNPKSQINVRVLSRNPEEEIGPAFFARRLEEALARRLPFFETGTTNAYRLVNAEADGLPGFVVDRYDEFLVLQVHTLGAERLKELLLGALEERLDPRGIFERSDLGVRSYEGLPTDTKGALRGEKPPATVWILENGIKLAVDIVDGQKTGFYLDQRDNRALARQAAKGRRVLNLFSYTCATSVAAALGGAAGVVSVDTDEAALALARANFEINGLTMKNNKVVQKDAGEFLKGALRGKTRYELAVVDPPAFAKHRGALDAALRGYRDLNAKVMRLLNPGGLLLTSSCSGLVGLEAFQETLAGAARDAAVETVILQTSHQPVDHPVSPAFPEGRYLKSCLLEVRHSASAAADTP